MKDYPSAHSMDTTWFGLDKDGHIAVFDSDEGGVVPEEWKAWEETVVEKVLRGSLQTAEDPVSVVSACGGSEPFMKMVKGIHPIPSKELDFSSNVRVMVIDAGRVKNRAFKAFLEDSHLESVEATLRGDEEYKTVVYRVEEGLYLLKVGYGDKVAKFGKGKNDLERKRNFLEELHETGVCCGCLIDWEVEGVCSTGQIFCYKHPLSNEAAFPYFLVMAPPKKAITLRELPKKIIKALEDLPVFDGLCFFDKPIFQPWHYMSCNLYRDISDVYGEMGEVLVREYEGS